MGDFVFELDSNNQLASTNASINCGKENNDGGFHHLTTPSK